MAEFPALPLWTDAFIADTVHLSAEETGAYMMLLMCAWRSPDCGLPDDDTALQRFSRVTRNRWPKIRDRVMGFWTLENGKWFQKRLMQERDFVTRKSQTQSQNVKARWLKSKETADTTVIPTPYQNDTPTPTPTSTYSEEGKPSSARPSETASEGLFPSEPKKGGASAKDRNKLLFDHGAAVLGPNAGGLISRLLKHAGNDYDQAEKLLSMAAEKAHPRQWVGAVIRGDRAESSQVFWSETDALYREWGVM